MTAINRTNRSKNFLQNPGHPHRTQGGLGKKYRVSIVYQCLGRNVPEDAVAYPNQRLRNPRALPPAALALSPTSPALASTSSQVSSAFSINGSIFRRLNR